MHDKELATSMFAAATERRSGFSFARRSASVAYAFRIGCCIP